VREGKERFILYRNKMKKNEKFMTPEKLSSCARGKKDLTRKKSPQEEEKRKK